MRNSFKLSKRLLILLLLVMGCTYDKAIEKEKSNIKVSFIEDIKPIIIENCYICHSDTATNVDKPGYAFFNDFNELKNYALKKSTADPTLTTLQARIRHVEIPGMPFDRPPLPEEDIQKIEAWIEAGAPNN